MKLLIGTMNALVLWDGEQKEIAKGNYYGITWDENNIYCSHNPLDSLGSLIKVFDKKFNGKYTLPETFDNVHQILMIDGRLYITHTGKDSIAMIDKKGTSYLNWERNKNPIVSSQSIKKGDAHHLNSIWYNSGKLYIVESGLSSNIPVIQVLDNKYNIIHKIKLPEAFHLHNVYIEKEILYCCGKYGLIRYDLFTKESTIIDLHGQILSFTPTDRSA